jgi:uncharacterized membrane protein HdeD (DUF308 family)
MATMDVASANRAIKAGAGQLVAMGLVMVVLGVLAIAAPLVAGIAIAYLVGGVVLVAGLTELVHALRGKSWGVGLAGIVIGLLALVCGVLMIAHPIFNLKFLTLLLVGFFIVEGLTSVMMASQMRGINGSGWTLFGGVMSLILGGLIWAQWPVSGAWAVGILVGVRFLCTGWAMIALGSGAKGAEVTAAATDPQQG